jgi:hypothetical protein
MPLGMLFEMRQQFLLFQNGKCILPDARHSESRPEMMICFYKSEWPDRTFMQHDVW